MSQQARREKRDSTLELLGSVNGARFILEKFNPLKKGMTIEREEGRKQLRRKTETCPMWGEGPNETVESQGLVTKQEKNLRGGERTGTSG